MKNTKVLYPQTQDTLFTQIEHSIFAEFFGVHTPRGIIKIPPLAYADSNEENGIVPLSDHHGEIGEHCLSNAVARIILDGLQKMLPNFQYYENESKVFSRKVHSLRKSKLHLRPMHLLHINWAFSGPGIAWPEQYYLCYVPIYGRYVVTASHDSTDVFGYNDIVIGQFKHNIKSKDHHAADIIKSWWRKRANEGGERFVEIISEGLIKKNEADMWANEIRKKIVKQTLNDIGMIHHGSKAPNQVSGGERARISVMRALLSEPEALLLDEPFSKLDRKLRDYFRSFVFEHSRNRNLPVLLVTHDIEDAKAAGGAVIEI